MVEIHGDLFVGNLVDYSVDDLACIAHHRYHLSDHEQILTYLPVDHECFFGQVNQPGFVENAVTFLGSQGEGEFLSGLQSFHFAFELGEEHSVSV